MPFNKSFAFVWAPAPGSYGDKKLVFGVGKSPKDDGTSTYFVAYVCPFAAGVPVSQAIRRFAGGNGWAQLFRDKSATVWSSDFSDKLLPLLSQYSMSNGIRNSSQEVQNDYPSDGAVVVHTAVEAAAAMRKCTQEWTNSANVITVDHATASVSYQQDQDCIVFSISSEHPFQFVKVSGLPAAFLDVQQAQQSSAFAVALAHKSAAASVVPAALPAPAQSLSKAALPPQASGLSPPPPPNFVRVHATLQQLQLLQLFDGLVAQDMGDDIMGDITKDDLLKVGFVIGNATRFLKAFAAVPPSSLDGVSAGGGSTTAAAALAMSSLSLSAPASPSAASSSDPYALFLAAYDAAQAPQYPDQLLAAVREATFAFCRKLRVTESEVVRYFKDIQAEALEHKDELLDSIAESAVLIWTSAKRLMIAPGNYVEFCSLLNRILREQHPDLLPSACVIVRGINLLCVMRRDEAKLLYPPGGQSHRGGGLPLEHLPFYIAGKKFRVPMFLATSFDEDVAYKFWLMAFDSGLPPVHWVVRLDPRGEKSLRYRCKHVNLVEKSNVKGEIEFLFAPFSVFTVVSVNAPAKPTASNPIVIVLDAAIDNRDEPDHLPLSPWN